MRGRSLRERASGTVRATGLLGGDVLHGVGRRLRGPRPSGKTVVMHPGFRKTGTTTIQSTLARNEALLGAHVGVVTRWSDPSSEAMHTAGQAFTADPRPATRRAVRRAARQVSEAIRAMPQRVVIVSDENVIGRRIVSQGRDVFDLAAETLAIVAPAFADHDLGIVLTTRRRAAWMRSCWNQDVKRHKFTGDLDAWLAAHDRCRDWGAGADVLSDALPVPVRFVAMEDELAEGRFLGRALLEAAGVPADVLDRVEPDAARNPSLDPAQIAFIREVNALDLPYGLTGRIVDVVRRRADLFGAPGGGTEAPGGPPPPRQPSPK